MGKLGFNGAIRRQLEEILTHPKSGRELKRAQGLLWVDDGEPVKQIAERLRVDRQSVYNWINNVQTRKGRIPDRLKDGPRSGRPKDKSAVVDEVLPTLLEQPPSEFGYQTSVWTNPLLREHFRTIYHLPLSHQTVRESIHRVGYRWKRPRYVLSRRAKHWRQAKGGLKRGSKTGSER